jgi:hypothetical protein
MYYVLVLISVFINQRNYAEPYLKLKKLIYLPEAMLKEVYILMNLLSQITGLFNVLCFNRLSSKVCFERMCL